MCFVCSEGVSAMMIAWTGGGRWDLGFWVKIGLKSHILSFACCDWNFLRVSSSWEGGAFSCCYVRCDGNFTTRHTRPAWPYSRHPCESSTPRPIPRVDSTLPITTIQLLDTTVDGQSTRGGGGRAQADRQRQATMTRMTRQSRC